MSPESACTARDDAEPVRGSVVQARRALVGTTGREDSADPGELDQAGEQAHGELGVRPANLGDGEGEYLEIAAEAQFPGRARYGVLECLRIGTDDGLQQGRGPDAVALVPRQVNGLLESDRAIECQSGPARDPQGGQGKFERYSQSPIRTGSESARPCERNAFSVNSRQ